MLYKYAEMSCAEKHKLLMLQRNISLPFEFTDKEKLDKSGDNYAIWRQMLRHKLLIFDGALNYLDNGTIDHLPEDNPAHVKAYEYEIGSTIHTAIYDSINPETLYSGP